MIDMRGLYAHPDYAQALSDFSVSTDPLRWLEFRSVQLKVTNNRCPICEVKLDYSVTRTSKRGTAVQKPTIDHYRPKDSALYPNLKYDHKNYLLMCSDCNNAYKGNTFPLHADGAIRDTTADDTDNITTEKPLIVNPVWDDLLELFDLVFTYTPSGKKVLELVPRNSDGYLHDKAQETIKVFSLGDCEVHTHDSIHVQNCRIRLLNDHFNKFYNFIKALKEKNKEKALLEIRSKKLNEYGFYRFIQQGQFKDLVTT